MSAVPFELRTVLAAELETTAGVSKLANGRLLLSVAEVVREKKKKKE